MKPHLPGLPFFRVGRPSRRVAIVAFTTIVIILLVQSRGSVLFGRPIPPVTSFHQCPNVAPKPPYIPAEHTRFNWRKVPEKYPVDRLITLSNLTSQSLRDVQHNFGRFRGGAQSERQQSVKEAFQRCWNSYRAKAWLKDELAPISGKSKDTFGGWGATLVDSLDTLWIMEMYEEFQEAVNATIDIDFGPGDADSVNIFETTIRYLGGFLAAYDVSGCNDKRLLDKAIEVGDMIYAAYDTPNRMPVTYFHAREAAAGAEQTASLNAVLAGVGSSGMELTRLSQLTGDMRYYDQAVRIALVFEAQQNKTSLPGMWPTIISAQTEDLTVGNEYTFGALSDSAYEYLPKLFQLLGGVNAGPLHSAMYWEAMGTATKWLFYRPMLPDNADVRIATTVKVNGGNKKVTKRSEHLSCFVGGMLALGGRLFNISEHVDLGRKVTDGCVWAYRHSRHGIMPEIFKMLPCEDPHNCTWDAQRWKSNAQEGRPEGFISIDDPRYILRPEAIESVFYLYRITGDESLRDDAWAMFEAIEAATRTELANAALKDVTVDAEHPPQEDSMESFWQGETLKYFYLIFSDSQLVSLDDFVFNTEAHPFRRPR